MNYTFDEWTPVTNFALATGFLNHIHMGSDQSEFRKFISNDLAAGLSFLFIECLPFDRRPNAFSDEFAFFPENASAFKAFLADLPIAMEVAIDALNFHRIKYNSVERVFQCEYENALFHTNAEAVFNYPDSTFFRISWKLTEHALKKFTIEERSNDSRILDYYIRFKLCEEKSHIGTLNLPKYVARHKSMKQLES